MFLKKSATNKKLIKSILVSFLISSLLINSGIGGTVFLKDHNRLGRNAGIITKMKARDVKKTGSGFMIIKSNLKPEVSTKKSNLQMVNAKKHSRPATKSRAFSQNDLSMLARIIHAEAGGESLKGQVAVGAVLLNRIKSGRFPRTVAANIFRPGEFESVSNGYVWSNPNSVSYKAARLALKGWDPTYGALYFFNPAKTYTRWIWSRPIHTVIGNHNFAG